MTNRIRSRFSNIATNTALATVLLAGAAGPALAANFPIDAGFNPNSNAATDQWTYREAAPGDVFPFPTLVPQQISDNIMVGTNPAVNPGWWDPSLPNGAPSFSAHKGQPGHWTCNFGFGTIELPQHTVFFHPGAAGVKAVLSFLVPPKPGGQSYQFATIKYDFTDLDYNGGDGVTWEIHHNDDPAAASGTVFSTNAAALSTTGVQTIGFAVTTGDRINFILDAGPNGDFNYDTTGLRGLIHLQ